MTPPCGHCWHVWDSHLVNGAMLPAKARCCWCGRKETARKHKDAMPVLHAADFQDVESKHGDVVLVRI